MISLHHIPRNSIIITPDSMIPYIKEQLSQGYGRMGIDVLGLNTFIKKYINTESKEEIAILFEYRQQIKQIYEQLHVYHQSVMTYTFMKECYRFIEELKREQVNVEALSEQDEAYQELKYIIKNLYPIETKQDLINQAIHKMKQESFEHVYIYPCFIKQEEQQYYDLLLANHAQKLKANISKNERKFFSALNKKEEIEGCVQYIIEHDFDADEIQLTLANQSYLPLVKQIFERYHLPYTVFCHDMKSSICAKRFVALIQYYMEPSVASVRQCLDCGVFHGNKISKLQEYLEIFEADIDQPFDHLQYLVKTSHLISKHDLKRLKKLQIEAEQGRIEVYEKLNTMIKIEQYEALFIKMIEIVNDSLSPYSVEIQVLDKIVNLLKEVVGLIQSKDDLYFMMIAIENLTYSVKNDEVCGIAITSLNQGSMERKHHFILGVDNKNFPAFPNKKGIFDETYYATTPLVSQQIRYEHYMHEMNRMLEDANNLYVSYSVAGYDGKGKEAALEIEMMFKEKQAYPLKQTYRTYEIDAKMEKDLAKQLYVHDGILNGSISSLERYVNCPFSYFLRYGLGISDPIQLGFSPSYMGTLAHYVLEQLVKAKNKAYTKVDEDELESFIQEEILALAEVFPNYQNQFNTLNRRILDNLVQILKKLDEYEKHSLAKPYLQEHPFDVEYDIDEDTILHMNGIIDRIDQVGSQYVIFDYKSSKKDLNKDKFQCGRQLQLVTYSVNLQEQSQQKVLGSYYISLKNENIEQEAYKVNRRKKEVNEIDEEMLQAEIIKQHRLQGWSYYDEASLLDDNGTHVKGFKTNKNNEVSAKVENLDELKAQLMKIFESIALNIIEGNIEIEPSDTACAYCKFKEICHFKGEGFEKISFIDEGGEEDANME